MLCRLSYKAVRAVCRAGVEPAQQSRVGYSHLGSPMPSRHVLSVPWMGFEPMISTSRAWRPLRAGLPGHLAVAQGGVEPPASLVLSKGGLPVAYRATVVRRLVKERQSARRESNPPVLLGRQTPGPLGHGHFTSAEGEGVEPSRALGLALCSTQVPSPVGWPFRLQSGWLDWNQRGPASDAGG